jgi:hypothetical protein
MTSMVLLKLLIGLMLCTLVTSNCGDDIDQCIQTLENDIRSIVGKSNDYPKLKTDGHCDAILKVRILKITFFELDLI